MLTLKKIAITGGVASGKSTVCRFFRELGACTVNADAIVHELLDTDADLCQQIVRLLGPEVQHMGKLSRRAMADKVFNDPEKLHALEKLLHPAVLRRIEKLYRKAQQEGVCRLFVVEVPLLYEAGHDSFYDAVIAVESMDKLCKERFRASGFEEGEWERRGQRQLDPREKAKRANYTIKNNGSLEALREQVVRLYEIIYQ